MSKPDDIPQDVWDVAVGGFCAFCPSRTAFDPFNTMLITEGIARAIMTERERCGSAEPSEAIELPRGTYGLAAIEAFWAGVSAAKTALRAAIRRTPPDIGERV